MTTAPCSRTTRDTCRLRPQQEEERRPSASCAIRMGTGRADAAVGALTSRDGRGAGFRREGMAGARPTRPAHRRRVRSGVDRLAPHDRCAPCRVSRPHRHRRGAERGNRCDPCPAGCPAADAWRCAVARNLTSVSCPCDCHRRPLPGTAGEPSERRAPDRVWIGPMEHDGEWVWHDHPWVDEGLTEYVRVAAAGAAPANGPTREQAGSMTDAEREAWWRGYTAGCAGRRGRARGADRVTEPEFDPRACGSCGQRLARLEVGLCRLCRTIETPRKDAELAQRRAPRRRT
jgi:hypothetical protein